MSLGFTYKKLITRVLSNNGLEIPNGQPLYVYNVEDSLYSEIKQTLTSSSSNFSNNIKNRYWCALYSLYVAEWFHREYMGDWSWYPVEKSINLDGRIKNIHIKSIFDEGLKGYWSRKIFQHENSSHSYLGSAFSEGGLPLKLITKDEGRFLELFRHVISVLDSENNNRDLEYEIKKNLKRFPKAFARPSMVQLIRDMSESILYLVSAFDLSDVSDPIALLDQKGIKLEDKLPLSLDSEAAKRFIRNLFDDAKEYRKKNIKPITVRHILKESLISVEIDLAKEISFETNRRLHSTRLDFTLIEGDEILGGLGAGSVVNYTVGDNELRFRPRKQHFQFIRNNPQSQLKIEFSQNAAKVGELYLNNSEIMVDELPVSFKKINENWEFCGQGKIGVKAELKVLLPLNAEIIKGQYLNEVRLNNYLIGEVEDKVLVKIDDDVYEISSLESFSAVFELEGKQLPYSTKSGRPIYLGVPSVNGVNSEQKLFIGDQLFSGNSDDIDHYGDQFFSIKDRDNKTIIRKKISVLPQDLKLEVEPGNSPREGLITLKSSRTLLINVLDKSLKSFKTKDNNNNTVLKLESEAIPPQVVVLEISSNPFNEPVQIFITFPSQGVLAYDQSSNPLSSDLTIEDLRGARMLFYPSRDIYKIEIDPDSRAKTNIGFYHEYSVRDKPLEINLFEFRDIIKSIFAITANDLDARVRLTVLPYKFNFNLKFRRYEKCNITSDENFISISPAKSHNINHKEISAVLMKFSDPSAQPIALSQIKTEGVGTGRFIQPKKIESSSLVIPAKDSEVMFRPHFLRHTNSFSSLNPQTLHQATSVYHPSDNPNVIDLVIEKMSESAEHSGWAYLESLYNNYNYLPLSTFKVWESLVKNDQALALLVFVFNQNKLTDLLAQLEIELSVLWELIPVSSWRSAYNIAKSYLKNKKLNEQVVNLLINEQLKSLEASLVTLDHHFRSYLLGDSDKSELEGIELGKVNQGLVELHFKANLLRNHASDNVHWPEFLIKELINWHDNQTDKPFNLIESESKLFHRNAVLIFPMYVAALTVGKTTLSEIIHYEESQIYTIRYQLKKLLEFDKDWFNNIYQSSLYFYLQKEESK